MQPSVEDEPTLEAVDQHGGTQPEARPRLAILTTGGTIAMACDAGRDGAVPTIDALSLVAGVPTGVADLQVEEAALLPSSHFRLDTLWALRERVAELMEDAQIDGVVITHGTDTLEETAYLLDITVPLTKPVVLTGAMRAATDLGYDGTANLLAAVRVAATPRAREMGVVAVFNDEVHAARYLTKTHTLALRAFESPAWGPVGWVAGNEVTLGATLQPHLLPWLGLEPNVVLITLAVGADPDLLEAALERGARGVVIEALGGGRVPPWWLPAIERARDLDVAVVIATRCGAGRVWDAYGYSGAHRSLAELGCLFADGLTGQKARIRLMVVLPAASRVDEVARLWTQ
mgnify:CR=1 FL=1